MRKVQDQTTTLMNSTIIQIEKVEALSDHVALHKSQGWDSPPGQLTLQPAGPLSLGT